MQEGKISFNEYTGKYELDNIPLSCGTCLDVWDGEEWLKCRVEYNDNWDRGYYLLVFNNEGSCKGSVPLWNKTKGRM
jgi:hypothetical protein